MTTPAPTSGATTPCRGAVRVLRTALPAVAAVLVAVGGHVAGGGAVPSATVLVAVAAGSAVLSGVLAGQRWTPRTVLGLLLALQAVVHLTCTMAAPAASGSGSTAAMLSWHLVATAVTTAALCWGESVLWSLVEVLGLRGVAVLLGRADVRPSGPSSARPARAGWVPLRLHRTARLRLRGPPLASC